MVMRAKVRTGNQMNRELIRRREQDPEWQEAWYGWGRGHVDLTNAEKYPQVFTAIPITGQAALFRYITTNLGLGRETYEQVIGPVPEDMGDEAIQFHNARVFLPAGASKRSLTAAMKTLEHVYQNLNAKGLSDVMTGDIRFMPLGKNVGGTYNMGNGDMQVSPKIKDSGQTIYSLLHEYGHKYMEEGGRRDEIVAKYEDLQLEGEGHMPNLDTATAIQDAVSRIQPGLRLTYTGRGRLAKDREHVVKSVSGGKAYVALAASPERVLYSIPARGLLNPKKFQLQGDIELPLETDKWNDRSDQWFVTPYAETNEQEWWAELFAFYTMGNLSGEPAAWIQQFLTGKQQIAATVGSNEGEVNSDSEMPPVANQGEEGNAQWDWTDPYHNSGAENAVNSRTP